MSMVDLSHVNLIIMFILDITSSSLYSQNIIMCHFYHATENYCKYLGITLDASLTYSKHVQSCINLASQKVFLLSKIRKCINFDAVLKIYKTMILPILEYGDILYDGCNQDLLSKIKTLQNRCLHLCNFEP